jgi:transcriptional regulator with XRE-family HTH domain
MTSQARSADRDAVLSSVLKALRRHRRMTVQEVADRMRLEKRTYERFEAGEGELKLDRIFNFAKATDADPYALLASVTLGSPDFALACADNKLALLFVTHARELHVRAGEDIRLLQAQPIVEVLAAACARLGVEMAEVRGRAAKRTPQPPMAKEPRRWSTRRRRPR